MYGNDVISFALSLHGILYVGQVIGTDALAICQTAFINLVNEWSAQGYAIFSVSLNSYVLTGGTGQYSLGANGTPPASSVNLSTTRAEKVESWGVRGATSGSDGGKPVSAADFETARAKLDEAAAALGLLAAGGLTGGRVKLLNYDADYPEAVITLYPVPSSALTLDLWTWDELTDMTGWTSTQWGIGPAFAVPQAGGTLLAFPPGYLKALCYVLACNLAPLFGRPVDPDVQKIADQCMATLGGTNVSELTRLDPKTVPPAR